MEEGRGKAIPLRRSRSNGATRPDPTPPGWRATLGSNVRWAIQPPRLVLLAGLGGTMLTLRAAASAWSRLVAEGKVVERTLLGPGDSAAPGSA
jgi:hypothetical protein